MELRIVVELEFFMVMVTLDGGEGSKLVFLFSISSEILQNYSFALPKDANQKKFDK